MTTLARIQAFYWSATLGSQDAAAERLHVTPSAVAKRLHELQLESAHVLFHSGRKGIKLTSHGRQLLGYCEAMIAETTQLEALRRSPTAGVRSISIGVTELTVMTWFGAFISRLRDLYPELVVVPHVDLSGTVRDMLQAGKLDIAILQEDYVAPEMSSMQLGTVPFEWVCKPGLLPAGGIESMQDLRRHPIIDQGPASGLTTLVQKLLGNTASEPVWAVGSSSMVALAALVEAGFGISCMPRVVVRGALRERRLQRIRTQPPAPSLSYYAVFHPHHHPMIGWSLAALARECCSFKSLA
jgi:DNA-binding transcriptional LysR family regulator